MECLPKKPQSHSYLYILLHSYQLQGQTDPQSNTHPPPPPPPPHPSLVNHFGMIHSFCNSWALCPPFLIPLFLLFHFIFSGKTCPSHSSPSLEVDTSSSWIKWSNLSHPFHNTILYLALLVETGNYIQLFTSQNPLNSNFFQKFSKFTILTSRG